MAECGDLPTRLVALHVDDGTGHCAGCTWWDPPRPVHPCTTRQAATRALHIQAARLAGRVLPIRPEPRRRWPRIRPRAAPTSVPVAFGPARGG